MEAELVRQAGITYTEIPAAGLHGVGLKRLPGNALALLRGYRAAGKLLRRFRPDVLFFTGGYVAAPLALAGRKLPALLYVPDIEPGLALKLLARFADRIAVSAEESRRFFSPQADVMVSGYPVRAELERWDRQAARAALGLSAELPAVLVFGGSKGARSINRALLAILPELLTETQVVHISGTLDWPEVEQRRSELAGELAQAGASERIERYHAFPYLHGEMGAAFAAADLAVCRAGASTLGELPAFGLPAVLVPYPYAWRYQRVNAEHLERQGAAVVLEDSRLNERLLPLVKELLGDRPRLEEMRRAARSLSRPQAAAEIARQLYNLAGKSAG